MPNPIFWGGRIGTCPRWGEAMPPWRERFGRSTPFRKSPISAYTHFFSTRQFIIRCMRLPLILGVWTSLRTWAIVADYRVDRHDRCKRIGGMRSRLEWSCPLGWLIVRRCPSQSSPDSARWVTICSGGSFYGLESDCHHSYEFLCRNLHRSVIWSKDRGRACFVRLVLSPEHTNWLELALCKLINWSSYKHNFAENLNPFVHEVSI